MRYVLLTDGKPTDTTCNTKKEANDYINKLDAERLLNWRSGYMFQKYGDGKVVHEFVWAKDYKPIKT